MIGGGINSESGGMEDVVFKRNDRLFQRIPFAVSIDTVKHREGGLVAGTAQRSDQPKALGRGSNYALTQISPQLARLGCMKGQVLRG